MKITQETVKIIFNPETPKSAEELKGMIERSAKSGDLAMNPSAYNSLSKGLVQRFDSYLVSIGVKITDILTDERTRGEGHAQEIANISSDAKSAVADVLELTDQINKICKEYNAKNKTNYRLQIAWMNH